MVSAAGLYVRVQGRVGVLLGGRVGGSLWAYVGSCVGSFGLWLVGVCGIGEAGGAFQGPTKFQSSVTVMR